VKLGSRSLRWLLVLALTALVLSAACDDDDDDATGAGAGVTTATAATDEETATATAAATETDTPEPTSTATPAGTPGASATVADSPYDSFHYRIEIAYELAEDETVFSGAVEGDFVAPDAHYFTNEFGFGEDRFSDESVVLGDRAWYRETPGAWRTSSVEALASDGTSDLTSADPEFFAFDREFASNLEDLAGEPETFGGIATVRYDLSEFFELLPDLLDADFLAEAGLDPDTELSVFAWADEEQGVIVGIEMTLLGTAGVLAPTGIGLDPDDPVILRLTYALSQIDDASIAIEAPEVGSSEAY
jgi:hypothetical protein